MKVSYKISELSGHFRVSERIQKESGEIKNNSFELYVVEYGATMEKIRLNIDEKIADANRNNYKIDFEALDNLINDIIEFEEEADLQRTDMLFSVKMQERVMQ